MRRAIAALAAVLSFACGSPEEGGPERRGEASVGDARIGGEVLATVEGHPVTRAALTDAVRRADVPPGDALRRLEDELLLAHEAARHGHGDDPAVERAARQALVQALLARTVEAEVGPEQIDEAAIEAAFEADLARWETPERRATTHLLVRVPEGEGGEAARAEVEAEIARAREADDPAAALRAAGRREVERADRVVEDVPPLARRDGADPAYLRAIFEADAEGLVPEPVRTAFGWHAIVVTEIQPATETSREDALAALRAERLAALRAARLAALLREIGGRAEVTYAPELHRRLAAIDVEAP